MRFPISQRIPRTSPLPPTLRRLAPFSVFTPRSTQTPTPTPTPTPTSTTVALVHPTAPSTPHHSPTAESIAVVTTTTIEHAVKNTVSNDTSQLGEQQEIGMSHHDDAHAGPYGVEAPLSWGDVGGVVEVVVVQLKVGYGQEDGRGDVTRSGTGEGSDEKQGAEDKS